MDFLSQKLFLCQANLKCCFLFFGKGRGDQTRREESRNGRRGSAGKNETRGREASAGEAANRDIASADKRTEIAGDKGNLDFLLI